MSFQCFVMHVNIFTDENQDLLKNTRPVIFVFVSVIICVVVCTRDTSKCFNSSQSFFQKA